MIILSIRYFEHVGDRIVRKKDAGQKSFCLAINSQCTTLRNIFIEYSQQRAVDEIASSSKGTDKSSI